MALLEKSKVNAIVVKAAPKMGGDDARPPRAEAMFSEPYANIFLAAKKKSGKTSTIFTILKKIVGPETKLVFFCSTINKDPSWKFMVDFFNEKGNEVQSYTSMREDGIDVLNELIVQLENEIDADDEPEPEPEPKPNPQDPAAAKEYLAGKGRDLQALIQAYNSKLKQMEGAGKPKRSKYKERKWVVVFDDLSTELKSKSLVGLLKKNRHHKMVCILSSQYYLDLLPESRKQVDYFLLFRGQTEDKLQAIYKDADISIPYQRFIEMYNDATNEQYHFLYVDTRNDEFRKDFNYQYNTDNNQ